ncbi:MAG: flagellar M-ring protein FliF, partial [Alphaproteobacteria bacterium]|nr:flagellar M-ring protein FliF [Alphaproteobacteria bacterium]
MSAFFGTLRALGPARLMAIGIVAVAMLGFFTFLTTRMGSAPMSLLYADLEQSDAAAMVSRLQQQKIPHEISADGRTLKVASNEVGRARMALASEGLPRGGSVGYEIFDQ